MPKPERKLIGTGEIHELYGLTRGQIFRLIEAGDWPEPVTNLRHGKTWDAEEVEKAVAALRAAGRIAHWGGLIPWRYLEAEKASA
jgi:predicted DNA-binding transcriptional regulator AlpA